MGHYCKICGKTKANEKFSGKGHKNHICKICSRKPKEQISYQEELSYNDYDINYDVDFNNINDEVFTEYDLGIYVKDIIDDDEIPF